MSTKSYSSDLRIRVIKYIETGNLQKSASVLFNISKTTVSTWFSEFKKQGKIAPKFRGGRKSKIDNEEFIRYIEENADQTLAQIAKHFSISACAVHKKMKKFNFRYKKKVFFIKK